MAVGEGQEKEEVTLVASSASATNYNLINIVK